MIDAVQRQAARFVTNNKYYDQTSSVCQEKLSPETFYSRTKFFSDYVEIFVLP